MTYGELVNNLRYLARVYSICENENMREYSLSIAAADAIENLDDICQHQADEIRELKNQWIPVTQRLPNFEGCLLCMRKAFVGDKLRYQDILYYDEDGFRMEFEDIPIPIESVTHWMPLPEPPEDGE